MPMIRRLVTAVLAAALVLVALPAHAENAIVPTPNGVFSLTGRGYGHGHGLSQWGAYGAARSGLTSAQILAFYYPGTALTGQPNTDIRVAISSPVSRAGEVAVDAVGVMTLRTETGNVTLPTTVTGGMPVLSWRLAQLGTGLSLWYTDGATGSWNTYPYAVPGTFASFQSSTGSLRLVQANFERRAYRGFVGAARTPAGFSTINTVAMEDYLRSVVPSEMSASWHAQALGAQAVAARTYASFDRLSRSGVQQTCDTTSCQVYPGVARYSISGTLLQSFEHPASDAAISATANQVLITGGAFSYAFTQFSAANGGWTAGTRYAYMPAKPDPYDGAIANNANAWTVDVTVARMSAAFPATGTATRVLVLSRDGNGTWGGRVNQVRIEGTAGSVTVSGTAFRSALGLRSEWFSSDVVAASSQASSGFVADISGDGLPDLVAASSSGQLLMYPGDAYGTVSSPVVVGSGWQMHDLVLLAGDLTGDGVPDIVARESATGNLWVYPMTRSGAAGTPYPAGGGWNTLDVLVAAGDVTGDGVPDLYGRDRATGDLYLYSWSGHVPGGSLSRARVNTGWQMHDAIIGVGDVTGDGVPDLVARHGTSGSLFLYTVAPGGGIVGGARINDGWGTFDMLIAGVPLGQTSGTALYARDPSRASGVLRTYIVGPGGSIQPGRDVGSGWNMHRAIF